MDFEETDLMEALAERSCDCVPHELIAGADIVYGLWPDHTMRRGIGSLIIKGAAYLKSTRPHTLRAIMCQCQGEADGYRTLFGDGSAFAEASAEELSHH